MAQKSYYDLNSLLHHSMMIIACCLFVACQTCQPFARLLLSLHDTKGMWVESPSSFYQPLDSKEKTGLAFLSETY